MSKDMYDPNSNDQLTKQRGICLSNDCKVKKYIDELQQCQQRLANKPWTAETCHQETVDLVEALDHCVADKAFAKMA